MKENIFRSYDIRGKYPEELDEKSAFLIGKAFAKKISQKYKIRKPRVIVGKDNRIHGSQLQAQLINGLQSVGAKVTRVEDCTSPMLYHAVCDNGFDGGINVTASHNPAEYNGFKLVGKSAHSIYGEEIQEIKQATLELAISDHELAIDNNQAITTQQKLIHTSYCQKINSIISLKRPLRIVVDAANGIAGKYYPDLLRSLGCEVINLYCEQDGSFPNHEADPVVEKNTAELKRIVVRKKADLGISFDGDGDRCAIVDEKGVYHDANESFVLLIRDILSRHPGTHVVYTVSCSLIIPEEIRKHRGIAHMVPVGHSFVERAMNETAAMIGGEQSGHFFITENYFAYDDAAYAAAKLLEIFSDSKDTVSEIYASVPKTHANAELRPFCQDDQKFRVIRNISERVSQEYECNTMDGIRVQFPEGGWLGIRASNTSPCISVCMEGKSEEELHRIEQLSKQLLSDQGIEF